VKKFYLDGAHPISSNANNGACVMFPRLCSKSRSVSISHLWPLNEACRLFISNSLSTPHLCPSKEACRLFILFIQYKSPAGYKFATIAYLYCSSTKKRTTLRVPAFSYVCEPNRLNSYHPCNNVLITIMLFWLDYLHGREY
jgi:hypothetical protein